MRVTTKAIKAQVSMEQSVKQPISPLVRSWRFLLLTLRKEAVPRKALRCAVGHTPSPALNSNYTRHIKYTFLSVSSLYFFIFNTDTYRAHCPTVGSCAGLDLLSVIRLSMTCVNNPLLLFIMAHRLTSGAVYCRPVIQLRPLAH